MYVQNEDGLLPSNGSRHGMEIGCEAEDDPAAEIEQHSKSRLQMWSPSGSKWKDFLHFVGPGWVVSIAYVDPGNYQADIQAGATSRYSLLFAIWWTSILSIYVQILCVRLAYYGGVNLAEVQARKMNSDAMRYLNWFIAEFSTVLTDLPEVIGIGIACHIFFGWPYYVGVLLSLLTTMMFLATLNFGVRVIESIIFVFVGVMSVALFVEMDFVGADSNALMRGWAYGFVDVSSNDIFAITGILGSVVMPHNLYLHTAACQQRPVNKLYLKQAVRYSSMEPVVPIIVSFFVNMAIVAIATEEVHGQPGAESVGLSDFCDYFKRLKAGCVLWGIALLAAGQSSAITTTFTGQYVMDGFLSLQLPVRQRAVLTRLIAITPCVIVSVLFPNNLNQMVNIVNSLLAILLPFAFTPLVKYNCSEEVMGTKASRGFEQKLLYTFAIAVWAVNAFGLSAVGGGFFGDLRAGLTTNWEKNLVVVAEVVAQVFYFWWNFDCLRQPSIESERVALATDELSLGDMSNFEFL